MKNNLSLKLISLLFAVIMWFYIIQVQSPNIETTVKDVPVLFIQKQDLENKQLMLINDKDYKVDLKLRGQRKILADIDNLMPTVTADVSNISSAGVHKVYTNVVIPYGNVEVVRQTPSVISVNVDEIVEVEKPVYVKVNGEPQEGYKVGEIKTTPSVVKLKGAKSILSGVDHISVTVDVDGKNEDQTVVDGFSVISTSDSVVNSAYITPSVSNVDVHCEILKKKSVSIKPNFVGEMQYAGYTLDDNSLKNIEIAGAAALLDGISEIQTEPITQQMVSEDGEVEVNLILPKGIESLNENKIKLKLRKTS